MDPLTALGLVGNVVQFVDFALKLISTGAEIAGSARGATEGTLELEKVCNTLNTFTLKLGLEESGQNRIADSPEGDGALADNGETKKHVMALEEIAVDCRTVCGQLLNIVKGLRVNKGNSNTRIKSFAAAIKTARAGGKISGLEERLKRFQTLITLHFFPLLNQQQSHMLRVLNRLQDQSRHLRLEQTAKFDELSKRLKAVHTRIQCIPFEGIPGKDGELPGAEKGTAARQQTSQQLAANTLYPKDLRTLEGILSDLNLTEKDLEVAAREQVLLESLDFVSRPYRHENIPVAHASTFEWIFPGHGSHIVQNDQKTLEQSRFFNWLQSGSGTFWVFGKAGAGKSTLMKFIASHHKTRIALKEWAGPKNVVMAMHYFWSTGTAMQKSLKGLLQELLYDILCCCPELAPDIFPDRWRRTKSTASLSDNHWSADELHEGLRLLARHHSVPVKCCFFIDGLDEFDGDHYKLCQLLKELSLSANLKCCVSSRPWNVFEDAFASDQSTKLCIHDLTIQDIWNYTESRLTGFPRWKETCISNERSTEFISDITERAQGVFLWVFLVTRSLRDGLVNGDTIHDLQRRLKALPTDLELFFKHMLDLVDPFYHQYMSRTFQLTINAKEPLQLLTYYVRESEYQNDNYVLELPLDPDLALANLPPVLLKPCRRRINARCGGLLGFRKDRVEFIHRTVHDFLLTRPMQDYLVQKAGSGYKVNLSTVKAFAFQFRCFLPAASSLENVAKMKTLWNECLRYANEALDEDEESGMNILDTVPDVYRDYAVTNKFSLRDTIDETYKDCVVAATALCKTSVKTPLLSELSKNASELSSASRRIALRRITQ
ncbi:hypothetical protein NA56DRAFT_695611 [Hyaloscypha hepaticicola]|uniref:NACHT domain-containing protein n=1 Tax=Hyaloscypha hepaticicola TaxID=2082293 RepID=A0A2J6PE36_9HELO|nr:hypothetical protein NA56DRAFT_695611 [Hyaloscypha hepaticicola]